jgi:soluble lytic murein transglycosylase
VQLRAIQSPSTIQTVQAVQTVQMILTEKADKYHINEKVFRQLAFVESGFNPNWVGRYGEIGLCQIKPDTAKWLATKMNIAYEDKELFNPEYNAEMSAFYLRYLLDLYNGNYRKAISSYNKGQNSTIRNDAYVTKVLGV